MTIKAAFSWMVCLPGALLASGACAADLTLYANDDYQGRALSVVIDERHLGVLNFDERASSVVVEKGTWVLCSDEDYGGRCLTLGPGRYASLQALGLNDEITSVRRRDPRASENSRAPTRSREPRPAAPPTSCCMPSDDYRGASHAVDQSQADLPMETLQGMATSVVIAGGEWELCDDTYFRGQCVTLGPGKYHSLKSYGLMRGASSVRRAPGPPHR